MLHDSANKTRRLIISRICLSVAFFADGLTFGSWVTRIPVIQERLGLSNASLGLTLLMMSVGGLISMPMVGRMSAKWQSWRVVSIAVAFFGVGLVLPALAPGTISLGIALFIFGIGFGAINVAGNAQAVTIEREYGRPIISSFHAIFSLGGIVGAGVGSLMAKFAIEPIRHFVLIAAVVVIAAILLAKGLLDDSPLVAAESGPVRKNNRLLLLGIIAFCSSLGEGAMADWSAVYLKQVTLVSASIAALGFAAFSFSMTTGRFTADRITAMFGPKKLVRLSAACAGTGLLLAMFFPVSWIVMIGFACVGAGLAALIPTIFRAAAQTRGIAPSISIAAVATTGYFGFLCGPAVIGFASQLVTLRWALMIVVAGCAVAWALGGQVEPKPATKDVEDFSEQLIPAAS